MKRVILILIILALLVPAPVLASPDPSPASGTAGSVKIPGGPKFWISNVVRHQSVKVRFTDYPKDKNYVVYLARVGTGFAEKYKVGALKNRHTKSFNMTFSIPRQLKHEIHIAILIWNYDDNTHGYDIFENSDGFNHNTEWSMNPIHRSSAQTSGKECKTFGDGPRFWVKEVNYPNTVTVRVSEYNGTGRYAILIGENSSNFQRIFVGSVYPKSPRSVLRTITIPASIRGAGSIMVRIENTSSGHSCSTAFTYESNWEITEPWGYYTVYTDYSTSSTATPFTKILNVVSNNEVTLQTFNLPADKDFLVTMGPIGSKGLGGFVVGTQNSGDGGSFIATYPIPAQLWGSELIAIRLQSTTSGHFAYDYFQNVSGYSASTSPTVANANPGWVLSAGTYPYTQVIGVVQDSNVTISGFNFTRNDSYTVYMGPIGSKGVGGVYVGDKLTDDSGTFTASFNIPDALKGAVKIAIRFESKNTPYYAFDWFYNSDSP